MHILWALGLTAQCLFLLERVLSFEIVRMTSAILHLSQQHLDNAPQNDFHLPTLISEQGSKAQVVLSGPINPQCPAQGASWSSALFHITGGDMAPALSSRTPVHRPLRSPESRTDSIECELKHKATATVVLALPSTGEPTPLCATMPGA